MLEENHVSVVDINKPSNFFLRRKFQEWHAQKIEGQFVSGVAEVNLAVLRLSHLEHHG